jgi:hypothetical protein
MNIPGKKIFNSIFLLSAVAISNTGYASGDEIKDPIAHGEEAHNNHCYKCHSDDVYTRENRFVKSIDALSKQVVRCKEGNDIPWFDEDADAVVQFLNKKYYRF